MNRDFNKLKVINEQRVAIFKTLPSPTTKRIFFVGASGSGKSTIWHTLKQRHEFGLTFPTRLVSRPLRLDDDPIENEYLPRDKFNQYFDNNQIEFFWPKFLPDKTEMYGFRFCKAEFIIYGCNIEFVLNANYINTHTDIFKNSLIVLICCSFENVNKRLTERYKLTSVTKGELEYRLASSSKESVIMKHCDISLNNDSNDIVSTCDELIDFLFDR